MTDHRINYTSHNLPGILGGDLKDLIDNLIIIENAEKLKNAEI